MSKSLTLKDRYYLGMYCRKLPCTLLLRLTINDFLQQIEFTSDELQKYAITISPDTHEFSCNDESYMVEYAEFTPSVVEAMKTYLKMFDHDKNKDSLLIQKIIETFKILV